MILISGQKWSLFYILRAAGFEIMYVDNNVFDRELNFSGAADVEILANWRARLKRMQGLRARFPTIYPDQ